AIALQLVLPEYLVVQSRWLLPGLELAVLLALVVANPIRMNRESRVLRIAGLALTGLLIVANAWAAARLAYELVPGRGEQDAGSLLTIGAAVWFTNVIAFALLYWEFDRGGPVARTYARRSVPDFLFVQMQIPELFARNWEPEFIDYLYLSFTNAAAF